MVKVENGIKRKIKRLEIGREKMFHKFVFVYILTVVVNYSHTFEVRTQSGQSDDIKEKVPPFKMVRKVMEGKNGKRTNSLQEA